MYGLPAVFLFVLHVSAYRWNTQAFTYIGNLDQTGITYRRSGSNECRVCFEKECLPFSPVECEYYIETNKIVGKDDELGYSDSNPQLRATVDSMVFSVVERAKSEGFVECLPYLSKYTDCTKENICLGCKTCDCDMTGHWNCTVQQTCRPELIRLVADQKTLLTVIENLQKGPEATRLKRSIYHSIRSLEDIDEDNAINDNRDHQSGLNQYQDLTIDMYPENTNAIYDEQNTNTATTAPRSKELVKLIVNSLIQDALPKIFRDNNLDFENNRVKRWITKEKSKANLNNIDTTTYNSLKITVPIEKDTNTLKNKITFEELTEWVKEIHPYINEEKLTQNTVERVNILDITTPDTNTKHTAPTFLKYSNPEYIAFEEVYNNIQVDNKTYVRRKPPLDHAPKYADKDFNMYDDKYYEDVYSTTSKVTSTGNSIVEKIIEATTIENAFTDDTKEYYTQSPTEVVVDLFEPAQMIELDNESENPELTNNKIDNREKLETINAVNIMKRDVSSSTINEKVKTNLTLTQFNTTTLDVSSIKIVKNNITTPDSVNYLKDNVLDPLDNTLENKQKEIRDILRMREHLVKFIQEHKEHLNSNISSKDFPLKLYKLEYIPHHHHDLHNLRRNNISMLEKYKLKLKRDVYEVIRDIVAIKKQYNETKKFPSELNFLIRSLKHYIHKTGFRPKGNIRNTRRNFMSGNQNNIKSSIIGIFELLVKNIRNSNALEPISQYSRKLIKRIIKKNYVDDFEGTGLKIYDPHYNLTNDLRNVGTQWQILTSLIETSAAADKLHNMKRLHLMISVDIAKINDAIALIDFARGRRMVPVDEADGEMIVMNINKNLNKIKHKIHDIISRRTASKPTQTVNLVLDENIPVKHKKKDSFMSQIKRLLTNSKKDILRLLGRKVPKSDIVKQIARKNVEEMTKKKLQDTMEKWQTNLNIIPTREKRSNKEKLNRRIKNIIPKYLRGKFPSDVAKGMKIKKVNSEKKNRTIALTGHKKKLATPKEKKTRKNGNGKSTTKHPPAKVNHVITAKKHAKKKHTTAKSTVLKYTTTTVTSKLYTHGRTIKAKTKS